MRVCCCHVQAADQYKEQRMTQLDAEGITRKWKAERSSQIKLFFFFPFRSICGDKMSRGKHTVLKLCYVTKK